MEILFEKKFGKNIVFVTDTNDVLQDKSLENATVFENIIKNQQFELEEGASFYMPYNDQNVWLISNKNTENYIEIGVKITKMLQGKKIDNLTIAINPATNISKENLKDLISGIILRDYSYNKYKAKKDNTKLFITKINFATEESLSKEDIEKLLFEAESVKKVRDFINCPPCDLYPEQFAKEIDEWLTPLGVKVKILSGEELKGMNLLLAVDAASAKKARVVVMEWLPDANLEKIALVGKGVTYDSGGLSLKGAAHMTTMKSDMSGAAAVVAAMANHAKNKINKNIVGIVGLVENMVSGTAYKPDDILISLSGQSVQISNTDAEGRLVLADIMEYVQKNYKPTKMIDLATLTGAIVAALSNVYAGLFSNSEELAKKLIEAGELANEPLWRMPLHKDYAKMLDCSIADMDHCGKGGGAGSSSAAAFLNKFVHPNVQHAHLDIAGVAFLKEEKYATASGATGFGVRLLNKFIENI